MQPQIIMRRKWAARASNTPVAVARPAAAGAGAAGAAGAALAAAAPLAADLHYALTQPPPWPTDCLIEWDDVGIERLAMLDFDWHDRSVAADGTPQFPPPAEHRLSYLVAQLDPQPVMWWRSKSGGIHAIYASPDAAAALNAAEQAMAAALALLTECGEMAGCTVELLTGTWHPTQQRESQVQARSGALPNAPQPATSVSSSETPESAPPVAAPAAIHLTGTTPSLHGHAGHPWLKRTTGETTPEDISQWLLDHGMDMGGSYPRSYCPYGDHGGDKGDRPVHVLEYGVKCHACAGKAVPGSPLNGYRSWNALLGTSKPNVAMEMARRFVHWDHAAVVLESVYHQLRGKSDRGTLKLLRYGYSGLLKLLHPPVGPQSSPDPRIAMAFAPIGFVRGEGFWIRTSDWKPAEALHRTTLACFPSALSLVMPEPTPAQAAKGAVPEAKLKASPVAVDKHQQSGPLDGYRPIRIVRGMWQWPHMDTLPEEEGSVLPVVKTIGHRQYVNPSARLPEYDCVAAIQQAFPGVDMDYIRLLLVARAYAQLGSGRVPIVLATGPSGSGKTTTVAVAARIAGDACVSVDPSGSTSNQTWFRQALVGAGESSGFVVLNEFGKAGLPPKVASAQRELLLQLDNRNLEYHRMGVGHAVSKFNAVLVCTAPQFGHEFEQMQVRRRVISVRLSRPVTDWQKTAPNGDLNYWPSNEAEIDVCNSYMSHIIDQWLPQDTSGGATGFFPFLKAAAGLGFHADDPSDSDAADNADEGTATGIIQELFALASGGKLTRAPDYKKGKGWYMTDLFPENPTKLTDQDRRAAELFRAASASPDDPDQRWDLGNLTERGIGMALGTDQPVEFDYQPHGTRLFWRFRLGRASASGDYRVNGEIAPTAAPE